MTKRWKMLSVMVLLSLLLVACGDTPSGPDPDFTLTVSPTAVTVVQGESENVTVNVARTGGFTGAVSLEVTGAPAGVTAAFNPATIPAGATTATLELAVAEAVAPGTYNLQVVATNGSLTKQAALTLTVTEAEAPPATLDRETAEQLAGVAGWANDFATVVLEPQRFIRGASLEEEQSSLPGPLLNLLSRTGITPQQSDEECITITGDETDYDEDGIPVDASYELDCEFTDDEGNDMVLTGRIALTDKDDFDPASGYVMVAEDYRVRMLEEEGWSEIYLDFAFDVSAAEAVYTVSYDFLFGVITSEGEALEMSFVYDQVYEPEDPNAPFTSGFFAWEGLLEFSYGGETYSLVTVTDGMHYSGSCNPPGFRNGLTRYADSEGNSLDIRYTACNSFEAIWEDEVILVRE